jgi:hypothetical protein
MNQEERLEKMLNEGWSVITRLPEPKCYYLKKEDRKIIYCPVYDKIVHEYKNEKE